MSVFQEIGVVPELIRAVEDLGWLLPTPIQQEAVPLILGGGDVMAAAETGSGKTGAFALPILQLVQESLRAAEAAKQLPDQLAERANGAEVGDCVLSSDDRDAMMAISPDGLTCQSRAEKKWQGCRATVGVVGGKVYWEAVVKDEGLCRVGWASQAATLELGTDAHGFGYGGTAKKSWKRQFEEYGEAYGLGDTIGCMLDCEEGSIAFSRNGRHLGPAFSLPASFKSAALFPAVCVKNAELQVNFGAAPFRHNPPTGFVGLAKAGHSVSAMDRAAAPAGGGTEGPQARKPSCIVLEPARDLAEQTHKCIGEFKRFMASPAITHLLLVGGLDSGRQAAALRRGVDIITGTPGRVMDLVESGKLAMDQVRFFVLDEADRLLDTGNLDVIMKMYNRLQKSGCGSDRLQVLMFSATLHSPEVRQLARQICQNPILIDLKGKEYVPETVDHVRVPIDPEADRSWLQSEPALSTDNCHVFDNVSAAAGTAESLSEAVKRLKPRVLLRLVQLYRMEQCLIFCRTNFDCNLLEQFLIRAGGGAVHRGRRDSGKENPFSCRVLAGQRSMDERREALQAFKDGDIRFLICTDVAARGIDIKNLPYVVNMTLPDKSEDYVHRIGRVGRADTIGLALSLVSTVPEKVWYCSVKDYKPWLQPKKGDVRTRECGGHTIWYNEPQLLEDIENRLGKSIPPVNSDLSLPREVAEKLSKEAAKYGEQRGGGVSAEVAEHLVRIQGQVAELSKLEWTAQASFFHMQMRWAA